ncbi:hypothetical protein [Pigmentiphaga kullae]|uniref:hypothetical protein n=1 Tax=Pigmentiphaga kullae TaxID=151784 RepID=UPI00102B527B|nr:hypothetical protein [Pigmentiphaga kullae]
MRRDAAFVDRPRLFRPMCAETKSRAKWEGACGWKELIGAAQFLALATTNIQGDADVSPKSDPAVAMANLSGADRMHGVPHTRRREAMTVH